MFGHLTSESLINYTSCMIFNAHWDLVTSSNFESQYL